MKEKLEEKLKEDYEAQAYKFFVHDLRNRKQKVYGNLSLADSINRELNDSEDLTREEIRNKQHQKAKYEKEAEEMLEVMKPLKQQAEKISRSSGLQNLDFQEVITNSLNILDPLENQQENTLETNFEADDYTVENYLVAERIFYNIVENALEHNGENVEITVEDDPDNLYIQIEDGYFGDINEIYNDDFDKAVKGSEITRETADLLGISIEQLDESYRIKIPKDYHADIHS